MSTDIPIVPDRVGAGRHKRTTSYLNGLKNGKSKEYYEEECIGRNKPVKETKEYVNGVKHEYHKKYNINGNITYCASYVNNKIDGYEVKYDDFEQIISKTLYINGFKHDSTKVIMD